jgi:hypothetical protein
MRDVKPTWTFGDTIALAVIAWVPFILAGMIAAHLFVSFN